MRRKADETAPSFRNKQRRERDFSLARLFVTCRAEITPLQMGISIGNPHQKETEEEEEVGKIKTATFRAFLKSPQVK